MNEDFEPNRMPESPERPVGPSIPTLLVIVLVSLGLGFVFSPADPISFILLSSLLLLLSVGSYFAGIRHGGRRSTSE